MTLFLLSIAILAGAMLIFFDHTSVLFWKISIAATEFGHWFFLLPLAIAAVSRFESPLSATTSLVSLVSVALLMWPAFSAMTTARSLPQRLEQAFGPVERSAEQSSPFKWTTLWMGEKVYTKVTERLTYVTEGGSELRINFFRADAGGAAPCIIVLHTGGWDSGSPDEFETMNRVLASRGYAVAAIAYRFAPEWKWPAQKQDVVHALSFLKKNASLLGIDSARFVLFGRSAGGQIAEAAAYTLNDPSIKGCIALYAPADLNFAYEHLSPEPDILDSRTLLENYLGGPQEKVRSNYDDASAYGHVSPSTPPTLLIHGRNDQLTWYRQSERLAKKLSDNGVKHLHLELPWATHAFDFNPTGPGGQLTRFAVEWFLQRVTR